MKWHKSCHKYCNFAAKINMKLIGNDIEPRPCVATIGSFDGVHQGHLFVIQQVVQQAQERGLASLVATFSNHPLQVLRSDLRPQLLSTEEEKIALLQRTEIDDIALLHFTKKLSLLSARTFIQTILKEQLQAQVLLIGYDNHFGHDHKQFPDYVQYGKELGIEVIPCQEHQGGYSSTAIRQSLLSGDIATANSLLGYPYTLQGTVVAGFQNGRKLGFPTANLQVNPLKLIPENGVYLVRADEGFGMLNIGTRPTLHNGTQRSIEVHLFDFEGDLYQHTLKIELLHHLRKERGFTSLEALRQQLHEDEETCRKIIHSTYYTL